MKVLVIGAGAIGAFYGGQLARVGVSVSVVARSDYDEVSQNGYQIRSALGDFLFEPEHIYSDVRDVNTQFDAVILSTKVLPSVDAPALLKPVLSSDTAIILIQNGIHIEAPIYEAFPSHSLISGLAFVCLNRTGPGHIHHQDYGRLVFGDYPSGVSALTDALVALFKEAGIQARATDNVTEARWRKLVWNAPFNPLSVLNGGMMTSEILADTALRERTRRIMKEVVMLARFDGVNLSPDVIEKNITDTEKMTPYKTSMRLDFDSNRPLEIDAILGNAIRFAEKHQVDVPEMTRLYNDVIRVTS